MLKIYYQHTKANVDARMFLDLNGQDYQVLSNGYQDCDFAISPTQAPIKTLCLDIWHNHENQIDRIKTALEDPNVWVISNAFSPGFDHPRYCYVDFLFNRTKAYYTQFPFGVDVQQWYHQGSFSFVGMPLSRSTNKQRIFVAPNKTYPNTVDNRKYRSQLVECLINYDQLGYIGNADERSQYYLCCHSEFPWAKSVQELEKQSSVARTPLFRYSPPHNEYYRDTFISIYGETIEHGNTIAVTEKTYDPLIKGHFILPFSTTGFVQHLKSLGFLFPDFIDYSYDDIVDAHSRYQQYQQEVKRLLSVDLVAWKLLWDQNLDIIYHNKRLMHERAYDRVDLKKFMQV
jgi:hypothetical protein